MDVETLSIEKQTDKDLAIRTRTEVLAMKILPPPTSLSHKDTITKIMNEANKTESTAKRYLKDLIGWGIIKKCEDGYYRLGAGLGMEPFKITEGS